jgi:hypothetical protein
MLALRNFVETYPLTSTVVAPVRCRFSVKADSGEQRELILEHNDNMHKCLFEFMNRIKVRERVGTVIDIGICNNLSMYQSLFHPGLRHTQSYRLQACEKAVDSFM